MRKYHAAAALAVWGLIVFSAACSSTDKIVPLLIPGQSPVVKEPYLVMTGVTTEIKVVWQTAATEGCSIAWGDDTMYAAGNAVTAENSSSPNQHLHSYTITGLTPGTVYFYRVMIHDRSYTGSFHAAPAGTAADLKFMVYGDTRTLTDIHDEVAGGIAATLLDPAFKTFILGVGDLVTTGFVEDSWNREFFNLGNVRQFMASAPFLSAVGNHDLGSGLFKKYFPYPYQNADGHFWSFDYGPVHVAVVDQYVAYDPASAQYAWLANDLSASAKTWKFIVLHQPGWSAAGGHSNDTDMQNYIQPLCESNGVSIVFAGHNHYYARATVNSVYHITTGGGGAPLHTPVSGEPNVDVISKSNHFCKVVITGNTLNFYAESPDGVVIDQFTINK
jgi:hypothetical protein